MAGIDKIYGTYEQWIHLHQWVAESKRPQYCRYFYPTPSYDENDELGPIMNTPCHVDRWLWDNCPFEWVKERLKYMYNGEPPRVKLIRYEFIHKNPGYKISLLWGNEGQLTLYFGTNSHPWGKIYFYKN
jgi:hypothetical protein